MGKNKRHTVTFFDAIKNESIEVDSNEEWYVYSWIIEAKKIGIVIDYEYQPKEFLLTNKFSYVPAFNNPKQKEKHLLADHVYTADFKIVFNSIYGELLSNYFKIPIEALDNNGNATVFIDVKSQFNRFGGDRTFSIHQKMVWDKYKIFVQKVIPEEMFVKLGMPAEAKYTIKTKKPTTKFVGCKTISNIFLNH